jgi:hypothetical protein
MPAYIAMTIETIWNNDQVKPKNYKKIPVTKLFYIISRLEILFR